MQARSGSSRRDLWGGDVVTAEHLDALAAALDRIGEADAPTLNELFTTLTRERIPALIGEREQLRNAEQGLAEQHASLSSQREAIAEKHDDAPPNSDPRPPDKAGPPGAPLEQLGA